MVKKAKKPILTIIIVFLGLCLVFGVYIFLRGEAGPYVTITDKGYKTFQMESIKFNVHIDCVGTVEKQVINEEMNDTESYVVNNDNVFLSSLFSKYLIYLTEIDITNTEDLSYQLKEFERYSGIRIKNTDLLTSGTKKIPYVKKQVYQCQAEAMLTKNLFGDFTGYLTFIHTEDESYFMFAGVSDKVEKNEKAMDAMWNTVMSAAYTTFEELRNPSERQEEAKEIDYAEMLDIHLDEEVNVGEYGYFYVINKSEETAYIEIAGKINSVLKGITAEEHISDKISQTIYKELPLPDTGHQWVLAALEYDTLGFDMSKVPPVVPVKIVDTEGKSLQIDTYTLQTDYQNHKIEFFYQLPDYITEYKILLGESVRDMVPLTVSVNDITPEQEVPETAEESEKNEESNNAENEGVDENSEENTADDTTDS